MLRTAKGQLREETTMPAVNVIDSTTPASRPAHHVHSHETAASVRSVQAITLDEGRAAVGAVVVPGTVPPGFQRVETVLLFSRHVAQRFSDGEASFMVHQSREASITVHPDHHREGAEAGAHLHVVSGCWATVNGGAPFWDAGTRRSILLELDGWAIEVSSAGQPPMDEADLLSIARSLTVE
jgi:hypothetical protein